MNVCGDCGYAFEVECCNPACVRVNPEAHARHVAEAEKREAEAIERQKALELWGKSLRGSF